MTDMKRGIEVATGDRPPLLVGDVMRGLGTALMEQQAVLMQAGVATSFTKETSVADFLRRNPMLDSEQGQMPQQTNIHLTGRLFDATVGVLHQLDRGQMGLHTYGFDEQERTQVVGLVHSALLETSPHIHRNTEALVSALRAADTAEFETHLNSVRVGLVGRYIAVAGDLDVPSLMLQRRYVEIAEALNGPMTDEEKLTCLANFAQTAASLSQSA